MPTLLLALDGPMQSWGSSSRFSRRETRTEPTKSGIIGLLASAEGRSRESDLSDLLGLRFGVRTDQVGTIRRDFQTETRWPKNGSKAESMVLTNRFYLHDYKFVAAVEGPKTTLQGLEDSLRHPVFPLYLGRRNCPPGRRVSLGIVASGLHEALSEAEWMAAPWYRKRQPRNLNLLVSRDVAASEKSDELVRDNPVSFSPTHRQYSLRPIVHSWVRVHNDLGLEDRGGHDPFTLLGGS